MNLREFLSHAMVQLPIRHTGNDFHRFVATLLNDYLAALTSLTAPKHLTDPVFSRQKDIQHLCETLPKVVQASFSGHPQAAYQHFIEAISPLSDVVQKQALELSPVDLKLMYRVRRDSKGSLSREDMFHIPFELRHLVSTQRYSVPGLPCLYLGGSLYTCWAEMGRPPFHELHASAYWLDKDQLVRILNFSDRPRRLLFYVGLDGGVSNETPIVDLLSTHLILWPLMALCSICVKHINAAYKPEYMFPQLVLQWITKEHNYDGVCYFSTHVDAVTTTNVLAPCNLVFPVRSIQSTGRCDYLRTKFRLTEPHNWQLLSAINAGTGGGYIEGFDFEFLNGTKEPYAETEFGRVQSKLNKLAVEDIQHRDDGRGVVLA